MKKIVDYIKKDTMILNLKSKDKKSVIKELFESLSKSEEITNTEKCYEDLLEREKLGSTGIGNGYAIPHAKTSGVKELILTIGISQNEIEYESEENAKAKVFFMFLSPIEKSQEYLTLLAKIARIIRDESLLKELLQAKNETEILEIISNKEEK